MLGTGGNEVADTYINEHHQARQFAQDFLAANPDTHIAVVSHGGIRLTLDRSGSEHAERVCTDCQHDIPGSCAASEWGEDGYLGWPDEPCYQAKEAA
jgi:hypothetical protein